MKYKKALLKKFGGEVIVNDIGDITIEDAFPSEISFADVTVSDITVNSYLPELGFKVNQKPSWIAIQIRMWILNSRLFNKNNDYRRERGMK